MFSPGGLLRYLYGAVEGELIRSDAPAAETSPQAASPLHPAANDDQDDEEAMDYEDQKEFLKWEVKLASRTAGTHDFEARDPALSNTGREKVAAQLRFVDRQLKKQQERSASARGDTPRKSRPVSGEEPTDKPIDDGDYEAARSFVKYAADNGRLEESQREALRPSKLSALRAWVTRTTALNEFFEQHREQEDDAASNANPTSTTSPAYLANDPAKMDDFDKLYEILNKRAKCPNPDHQALLMLPDLHNPAAFGVILSICSESGQHCHWHETSFTFETNQGARQRENLDICERVRGLYLPRRRRLCLSFDKSEIRLRKESDEGRDRPLHEPKERNLGQLLQQNSLRDVTPEDGLKKSRLALQLASLIQRLYPGPWVQQDWNAETIQLLRIQSDDADDLNRVGIPCHFIRSWKATNTVWQEFFSIPKDSVPANPAFFLFFAQLLVDISEGPSATNPPQPRDTLAWCQALIEKVEKIKSKRLLNSYSKAIRGCIDFAVDYDIERDEVRDPRKIARELIRTNIVQNLDTNFRSWEAQRASHSQAAPRKTVYPPGTAAQRSNRLPNQLPAAAEPSYFNLFAKVDEESVERKPDDPENEFMTLMDNFTDKFILKSPPFTGRRIRIAVLDTGLYIDEDDEDNNVLRYAGERIVSELSRNYTGNDKERRNYVDKCGHGTHIVRLLLSLVPDAEIVVVKISEGPTLESTQLQQVADALEWAGGEADADIINLSFGLDDSARSMLLPRIQRLSDRRKLIFAAASNSGGDGRRAYPAWEFGVFAIHATRAGGSSPENLNPPQDAAPDYFGTLGCNIPSRWNRKDVLITGTSFAAPIAAAIAANILAFVRRAPPSDQPLYFFRYSGMKRILTHLSSRVDRHDYIRPWKDGMFNHEQNDIEHMQRMLELMSVYDDDERLSAFQEAGWKSSTLWTNDMLHR